MTFGGDSRVRTKEGGRVKQRSSCPAVYLPCPTFLPRNVRRGSKFQVKRPLARILGLIYSGARGASLRISYRLDTNLPPGVMKSGQQAVC
jgi:hypothetical protein